MMSRTNNDDPRHHDAILEAMVETRDAMVILSGPASAADLIGEQAPIEAKLFLEAQAFQTKLDGGEWRCMIAAIDNDLQVFTDEEQPTPASIAAIRKTYEYMLDERLAGTECIADALTDDHLIAWALSMNKVVGDLNAIKDAYRRCWTGRFVAVTEWMGARASAAVAEISRCGEAGCSIRAEALDTERNAADESSVDVLRPNSTFKRCPKCEQRFAWANTGQR